MPQRLEAEALFHAGNRHLNAGQADAAQACFRQAIALDAGLAEAHANLGFLLDQQGERGQAEACYRQSLMLSDSAQVQLNLGALLAAQGDFDGAQEAYSEALALQPESAPTWSNLGVLYLGAKREDEAERFLRQALALDPAFAKARFNLSYLLLRQGRFAEGWACLQARDWYRGLAEYLACPLWQGEPLAGKTLLIGYEAGHGDVIQFCRYAGVLKVLGTARITLICHPALKPLLASLAGVDEVLAFDDSIPRSAWDFWTPLLSIPFHCQTREESIPARIPYLQPEPDRLARWAPRLPRDGLRVGLVWKGNPKFENDADRSLERLDLLEPLGRVPGVRFISLQKGAGEDQAAQPPTGLPLLDLGAQMADFADAAALVAQMDLMICVDTAMAHLAGALGKPCWLLLPDHMTDWRWQSGRTDSPWYPGVLRLFRQPRRGDWAPVVAELVLALRQFVRERNSELPP
jgi:tetratricopeptide (TPR) repeat protein